MSESQEQIALFDWVSWNLSKYPELEWLYHIPNGGKRHISVAIKLKKEGVKSGVPDLCLPIARGEYHGLYIEMKAGKGSVSTEQKKWLVMLSGNGYCTEVCYGWESAKNMLINYLKLEEK